MNDGSQVSACWARWLAGAAALVVALPALAIAAPQPPQGAVLDVPERPDTVATLALPPAGGGASIVSLGLPGWPTTQNDLLAPFLLDPTLRGGDVVATASGLMVFEGRRGSEHQSTDFKSLASARSLTSAGRAELASMEQTMRSTPANIIMVAVMVPRSGGSAARLGRSAENSVVALAAPSANRPKIGAIIR